ncbi:DUF2867 domain-containing protein [Hyunsoonleella pacifica]|uniref:DUF2867 domain-containing protein n=1 Tax=Hyunsoonleella pacifica TaxID=1080224 RepID=A0A4Q9FLT9_9FLAO|nr:DUF2867 domain-containing protein [Hyunsoonleella pacifica]TBN14630.1 DUF2867 domain-containing protein [Hyunsoonleella pacifica]GGD15395.1 hypothetical protein GCM10011368_16670 [Hyunsoonleella pacifica]
MVVKTEKCPDTLGIKQALSKIDFTDTFSITNHKDSLETIAHLIFGTMPKWVAFLMRLRNAIVKVFGLKTDMDKDFTPQYKPGENIGFIKVFSVEDNEILLGADDKHLDFRVSVFNSKEQQHNIKVTTLVKYNNLFGKIYMALIRPFHVVIVKRMVKQAYKI